MFEVALLIDEDNNKAKNLLIKRSTHLSKEFGITLSVGKYGNRILVKYRCEDYDKSRLKFFLSDIVSEIICVAFKEEFLLSKFFVKLPTENKVALLSAMLGFDKETDRYIVNKNFFLKSKLDINSFFNFRLKALAEKWRELVTIANENSALFGGGDCYLDLVRFLIENMEIETEELNVICEKNHLKFYDGYHKELTVMDNANCNENLIKNIISLSPKKINLYHFNDSPSIRLLSAIYSRRLQFINNKNYNNLN